MKVSELLSSRRKNWQELDRLCSQLEHSRKGKLSAPVLARFAARYRATCADLALAESYQLPPNTIQYLHQLVGRAHNQLYPSRKFKLGAWRHELLHGVPQRLFNDPFLWLAFLLFWGMFLLSMFLAAEKRLPGGMQPPVRNYAEMLIGEAQLEQYQNNFSEPLAGRDPNLSAMMAGFYIFHNTGIGLKCFAGGLVFGIGGLLATTFNAAYLGAVFGFMLRVPERENFFEFVTAHGPFELTAIVLSAAAGLRWGFSLIDTGGRSRIDALRHGLRQAMPTVGTAIVLFLLAALIEAFISPSALPYQVKAGVAVLCSGLLVFYFVLLGWPRGATNATG
ncbi:MAG: stage II sporulation protein M [Planctomycetales bacterium]|nr:stage II sporulation protein M [Planctomycetales bacterium]NIM07823.1 stage II sporulation protein M [Planctomycetales bacterium]NIN07315.1 stage II sporulation protein M [Planctomycetales bacterium]NIN76418.1 stage II sporulation protein M [Planctomycetales bacterium]NIO33616.1 stage II sporulation protein M [Planctomycetales bacterium]